MYFLWHKIMMHFFVYAFSGFILLVYIIAVDDTMAAVGPCSAPVQ